MNLRKFSVFLFCCLFCASSNGQVLSKIQVVQKIDSLLEVKCSKDSFMQISKQNLKQLVGQVLNDSSLMNKQIKKFMLYNVGIDALDPMFDPSNSEYYEEITIKIMLENDSIIKFCSDFKPLILTNKYIRVPNINKKAFDEANIYKPKYENDFISSCDEIFFYIDVNHFLLRKVYFDGKNYIAFNKIFR